MGWTEHNCINDEDVSDGFNVLVVDDDSDCIELLRLLFKMEGLRITSASSADEALELLKSGRFSLMLTDYNMPGKDGLMLSVEARKLDPELIIIMATGNYSEQLTNRAAKFGIMAVLAKPIDFSKLFSMVRIEKMRQSMHRPQADYGLVQAETYSGI